MKKTDKLVILPKLCMPENQRWFVYYQVLEPKTGKMKPIKVYKGLNGTIEGDVKKRRAIGEAMVKEITIKLKAGWLPNASGDDVIYKDSMEYQPLQERFSKMVKSVKTHKYYLSMFLDEVQKRILPSTFKTYRSKMRIYNSWLDHNGYENYDVSAIDQKIVKAFIDFLSEDLKRDRLTIEKYVAILRSFYDFVGKQGRKIQNPVFDMPKGIKRTDMAARPLTDADLKAILGLIRPREPQLYLACMFEYYLGIRPGKELRLLKVKDLDLYNNRIFINDVDAKVKKRVIDMPRQLVELCEEYLITHFDSEFYVFGRYRQPGPEPTGKNTLRNRFNVFRDRLGIPDTIKFYSMKHTGGGKLLKSGASIEELRYHFGHERIETTDRYIKRHFGQQNPRIINSFPDPE